MNKAMEWSLAEAYLSECLCAGSCGFVLLGRVGYLFFFFPLKIEDLENRGLFGTRKSSKIPFFPCGPAFRLFYSELAMESVELEVGPMDSCRSDPILSEYLPEPQVWFVPSSESWLTYHVIDLTISAVSDPQDSRLRDIFSSTRQNGFRSLFRAPRQGRKIPYGFWIVRQRAG
jgi:hypothetical protein